MIDHFEIEVVYNKGWEIIDSRMFESNGPYITLEILNDKKQWYKRHVSLNECKSIKVKAVGVDQI